MGAVLHVQLFSERAALGKLQQHMEHSQLHRPCDQQLLILHLQPAVLQVCSYALPVKATLCNFYIMPVNKNVIQERCVCVISVNKGKKGRLPLTCVIIAWSFNKWISNQKSASASNKTRINIVIILYAWTIITKQCYQSPNQLLLGLFACKQPIQVIGYQLSPFYLIWHE